MATFRYKAVNESGAMVSGVVLGDSPADARAQLRRMRLFPEQVAPAQRRSAGLMSLLPGVRVRAAQQVALFTRQCAILLASGVPIVEAAGVLAQQVEHRRLAEALFEIRESVNAGSSFAEALAGHPQFFDRSYIDAVASGEKSGTMDVVFTRLADFLERKRLMHARVSTALIYPAILVVMAIGLIVFLSGVVVPMLAPLLAQHQKALPLSTRLLFAFGDFVRHYLWVAVPIALVMALGLAGLRRSTRGRRMLDATVLRLPLIGKLVRKSLLSRFSMSFATLLHTGVPALEALETLSTLAPNAVFAEEIVKIRQDVVAGKDISSRMQNSRLFPPMVGYMVAVGERSGRLAEVLEHVSAAYDMEVEIASRRLLAILEPVILLAMAAVVGFIAMSLMVTILELSNI